MKNIIIDCFAGGGGASVGIEMSLGRQVDIAINHDPDAILMHKTNHPDTLHLTEDIFKVDLKKYVKNNHVALMWASPDCTSHSKAKGGKPREKGLRILPWAVFKHAKEILPDVIIMENVEEIQQWGPLDEQGHPIKEKMGEDYDKFISAMKSLGYMFECKELVAADFGAPTTRKRWYAIFRRDGKSIRWPEPTHNKNGTNGLKKWIPIHTVLDFTNLGKSIFGRKKPLAENTMRRIARGMKKFIFECPNPFIIPVTSDGDTVSTVPFVDKSYGGNYIGSGSNVGCPLHTITTVDHNRLVSPVIVPFQQGKSKDPSGGRFRNKTVKYTANKVASEKQDANDNCSISPFLIQYHSETRNNEVRGQSVKVPIQTIDTSNRYAEVFAFLTKFYKSGTGQSMYEPIHTITTSPGHFGQVSVLAVKYDNLLKAGITEEVAQKCTWVSSFIIEYYGHGTGQSILNPLHTIVTKSRFALITVLGSEYVIVDIMLRMLTPEELKLGQGFPKDYIIDHDYNHNRYPISKQVARIGNSVVPIMAQKLVEANCGYRELLRPKLRKRSELPASTITARLSEDNLVLHNLHRR